ncbi:MAG: hypothetical protein LBH75_04315 [Treponema sp.]|nr:hypothetical protein [Treponema sp.]
MKKPLLLALGLLTICTAASADETIMINLPTLKGFSQTDASTLPVYVQKILTDNFVKYSGIRVISSGDVTDYFLFASIERHSASRYSINLSVQKGDGDNMEVVASSTEYPHSLDQLMFGPTLNTVTKKLLTNSNMRVKLTAANMKELDKPLDSKYAEGISNIAKASAASSGSFEREQNANVAADLGRNIAEAGLQLAASSNEQFALPEFRAPVGFTATTFKFTPPGIQTSRRTTTVEGVLSQINREHEIQAANKAGIEEQQQYLLRQRDDILSQWQDFLGEVERRRQTLREEEQKLFQVQAELEARLREGEEYYKRSPPFRILYNPTPEVNMNAERRTVDIRFQAAAEPTSLKALEVRFDTLMELNKYFVNVNKAFEDVNTVISVRFTQVETAMNMVKDAMDQADAAGASLWKEYRVAPLSPVSDWTVPLGNTVYGEAPKTSWTVGYPTVFNLTVSLLAVRGAEDFDVIQHKTVSLTGDLSWNGPLKPESASVWGYFDTVNIDDLPRGGGALMVQIEAVNDIDTETAAVGGYIEIIPDGPRTATVGKQAAARKSWRNYWVDTHRFNGLGVAIGTTGYTTTPSLLVSARVTFSPFSRGFIEIGSDFGLAHGEQDVSGVEYLSIAPYIHLNALSIGNRFGAYVGIGGGMNFSRYTYPSESHVDPVTMNTPVADFLLGLVWVFPHSGVDLRWTIKTNFTGTELRSTLGYVYRFGYFRR